MKAKTLRYWAVPVVVALMGGFLTGWRTPAWAAAPTPSGIVGWWPGDNTTLDIIGGNGGVWNGGAYDPGSYNPGQVLQGFNFNGTDTYLLNPPVGKKLPQGTVEMWFNVRDWNWDTAPNGLFLWSLAGATHDMGSWDWMNLGNHQGYTGSGELMFGIFAGDWQWAHSGIVPQTDEWYHVAGSWGPAGVRIYVNGVLKDTNGFTGGAPGAGVCDLIGRSSWAGSGINGIVDEVSVYNRALTTAEIAAIYNAGYLGKSRPYYWNGGHANWSDPNFWSPAPPPGGALVVIPAGSDVDLDVPDAQIGGLVIQDGSTVNVLSGSSIILDGQTINAGTMILAGDVTSNAPGNAFLQTGMLLVQPGVAMRGLDGGGNDYAYIQSGGVANVGVTMTTVGTSAAQGGLHTQNGSTSDTARLEVWNPLVNGGTMTIHPDGVLDTTAGRTVFPPGDDPAIPTLTIEDEGIVHNRGIVIGGILVRPGGVLAIGFGATGSLVPAEGDYYMTSGITNLAGGKIRLGGDAYSYDFYITDPDSVMVLAIESLTRFGNFTTDGNIILDGQLLLKFPGYWRPQLGDEFLLFTSPNPIGGGFSSIQVVNAPGFHFTEDFGAGNTLTLIVDAIPEPSALVLLATIPLLLIRRDSTRYTRSNTMSY